MFSTHAFARFNLAAKVALVAALAHGALFSEMERYQGKGWGWRLLFYPLSGLLVPLIWWHRGHKPSPYPHHLDLVVLVPFLLDTLGNSFNLFDTINWWDDFMRPHRVSARCHRVVGAVRRAGGA